MAGFQKGGRGYMSIELLNLFQNSSFVAVVGGLGKKIQPIKDVTQNWCVSEWSD